MLLFDHFKKKIPISSTNSILKLTFFVHSKLLHWTTKLYDFKLLMDSIKPDANGCISCPFFTILIHPFWRSKFLLHCIFMRSTGILQKYKSIHFFVQRRKRKKLAFQLSFELLRSELYTHRLLNPSTCFWNMSINRAARKQTTHTPTHPHTHSPEAFNILFDVPLELYYYLEIFSYI